MSGIAALVTRDGRPAPADQVLTMLDAIPYRGPDGAFARRFGAAVLGHARMITTASERAMGQPLVSDRTGCAIVADIRLDNRAELRARLGEPAAEQLSDALLVLRAYEAWGLNAPRHLLGDFAFAIWDPRHQRLVCARDSAAQRTLFYREDPHTFAAASEIQQLLQDPAVPIEPDDERIFSALVPVNLFQNEKEQSRTYYKGISSLLPGHVLVLERDQLQIRRFWQFTPPAPIRYRKREDYVEHFRELFFQAVSDRLQSDVPIGALLSGGLDSTSIVCSAQELYRSGRAIDHGFQTFSAIYPGLDCDEQPLIEDVQARYGFKAHYLVPDHTRELLPLMPHGFRPQPDLPTAGLATLFDAAAKAGSRVLLTGEIADGVVRGSPLALDSLLRQGKFNAFVSYLNAYRAATRDSLHKTLALYAVAPLLPLAVQKRVMTAYASRNLELERWWLVPRWMPDGLRDDLFARNREAVLGRESARRFANETLHLQHLYLDTPEIPSMAMGWPIELWRPFGDRRLQTFLMAIPPEQQFEPQADDPSCYGGSKQLVRRAMRGMLPESIRARKRPTQFNATVGQEINRQWPLYEAIFGPDGRSVIAELGYVDQPALWRRLHELRTGRSGGDFLHLKFMIGLETWVRSLRGSRTQVTTVSTRVRSVPAVLVENAHVVTPQASMSTPANNGAITILQERR